MSNVENEGRYAPPRAAVEDVVEPSTGPVLATRTRRFWSAMVDGLVVLTVMGLATWFTPWQPFDTAGRSLWRPVLLPPLAGFGLFLLINGYLLATASQTFGKRVTGLRIVRSDGSPISFGRLIGLRYAVPSVLHVVPMIGQVFGVVDALFIFRESRRCLHDNIADTVVIKV